MTAEYPKVFGEDCMKDQAEVNVDDIPPQHVRKPYSD